MIEGYVFEILNKHGQHNRWDTIQFLAISEVFTTLFQFQFLSCSYEMKYYSVLLLHLNPVTSSCQDITTVEDWKIIITKPINCWFDNPKLSQKVEVVVTWSQTSQSILQLEINITIRYGVKSISLASQFTAAQMVVSFRRPVCFV